jgi:NADPH:quinone reductase-like Zn-dependent oxidoreductase
VDVAQPTPQANEVLIKVRSASVDAGVWHLMRGTPFLIRLMYGGSAAAKTSDFGQRDRGGG